MVGESGSYHFNKKSFFALLLCFVIVFGLVSSVLAKPVQAKTVRLALVSSLEGEVTVKKGGGSKVYDAYQNMSLNQGDTIYTGSGASVTLDVSGGDAELTIGGDSEFNISDLAQSGGKKSKLKMWAGSMWVKVKSLAGSNDEFDVETPTAVMGVRGTQFFVGVDPNSGSTTLAVGAGQVEAQVVVNGDNGQSQGSVTVLPTQQFTVDSRNETQDLSLKVEPIDIDKIVAIASQQVLETIIKNKKEIDEENAQFIEEQKKKIAEGGQSAIGNTTLVINNQNDLNKVSKNLDNLVGNIAKKAVEENVISKNTIEKIIQEANDKITDSSKKLDLTKVEPLDKTAGVDPEQQKKKEEELKKLEEEKQKKEEEKKKQQEEVKKKLEAFLKKDEEGKKLIAELVKKAEEEAKAKAEEELKKKLTDAEKEKFEKDKKDAASPSPTVSPSVSPTVSPTTSPGSSDSSDTTAPTGSLTINSNAVSTYFHTLKLTLSTDDASEMKISETSNFASVNWEPFKNSKSITLSNTEAGDKTIYLRLKDASGNESTVISKTIKYVIPFISVDSVTVTTRDINLTSTAYDATHIRVSEFPDHLSEASWITLSGAVPFHIATSGYGEKTIYAQFKNNAGIVSEVVSKKVTLSEMEIPSGLVKLKYLKDENTYNVGIYLSNFTGLNEIYAAEVHLVYDDKIVTQGESTVYPYFGHHGLTRVFSPSVSVESAKQYSGDISGVHKKELVYVVTQYGTGTSNISIENETELVNIPFSAGAISSPEQAVIQIAYVVIVKKDGTKVHYEIGGPLEINVTP